MVIAVEDIVDATSLKAWLNERPEDVRRQCAVWIAFRVAARVAPIALEWYQFSNTAIKNDKNCISLFRNLLIAQFGSLSSPSDVTPYYAESTERSRASVEVLLAPPEAHSSAFAVIRSASIAGRTSNTTKEVLETVARASEALEHDIFSVIRSDCQLWTVLEGVGPPDKIRLACEPLWPEENLLSEQWEQLRAKLKLDSEENSSRNADWSFWINWYDDLLLGRMPNVELLREVVTSNKVIWDQEIGYVIHEIQTIAKKFEDLDAKQFARQLAELTQLLNEEVEQRKKLLAEFEAKNSAQVEEFRSQVDDIQQNVSARFQEFLTKRTLEKPSELWDEKQDEHRLKSEKAYGRLIVGLMVTAAVLLCMGYLLIFGGEGKESILGSCENKDSSVLCSGFNYRTGVGLLSFGTVLTLALWFIRIQLKVFLAERHLMVDARERMAFSEAYMTLLQSKDNLEGVAEQSLIVYNALFRPTSDGIIKEDGGVDPSLSAAIAKFLAK